MLLTVATVTDCWCGVVCFYSFYQHKEFDFADAELEFFGRHPVFHQNRLDWFSGFLSLGRACAAVHACVLHLCLGVCAHQCDGVSNNERVLQNIPKFVVLFPTEFHPPADVIGTSGI